MRVTVIATGFHAAQQAFKPKLAAVGNSAYARGESLDAPAWSRWHQQDKIVNE